MFSSVAQSCLTLCDPMDCSTPGLPVHHQLPQPTQTHVHWVGDAIQPSHPLLYPSPPAFSLSQHQGLFKWVSSSHQVVKVSEFQLQYHPSNKYSGLISFKIDWSDLFTVQGMPFFGCPINMESSMELCSLSAGPALQPKHTSLCGVAVQDQGILIYGLELLLVTLTRQSCVLLVVCITGQPLHFLNHRWG